MSPRNRIFFILFLAVLCSCSGLPRAHAQNPVIRFYQDYISPVDGNRCPMHPSCSAYAGEAFEKHGLLMGWIMTCDRLVRCGRDETMLSPSAIIDHHKYTVDPVMANDFWWFEKNR